MFLKFFKPTINSTRFKKIISSFLANTNVGINNRSYFFKQKRSNIHKFLSTNNNYRLLDINSTRVNSFFFFQWFKTSYSNIFYAYCFHSDCSISIKPLNYGFSFQKIENNFFSNLPNSSFSTKLIVLLQSNTMLFFVNIKNKFYATAAGTYCTLLLINLLNNYILILLPSKKQKLVSLSTTGICGRASNIFSKYQFYTSFKQKERSKKHSVSVRGIATNPVDHPNGGRSKVKKPFLTAFGKVAKNNK